ncbi:MAG TPA: hypothetical protein VFG86_27885 [Chloroflexota bacterium]|nr:hypothetical protein [Chloroflexota bacterium]
MEDQDLQQRWDTPAPEDVDSTDEHDEQDEHDEHHATTGGAAAVGAVTGGVVGLAGGPIGAAVGAVGGALIGVAAERIMHHEDDTEQEDVEVPGDESDESNDAGAEPHVSETLDEETR